MFGFASGSRYAPNPNSAKFDIVKTAVSTELLHRRSDEAIL